MCAGPGACVSTPPYRPALVEGLSCDASGSAECAPLPGLDEIYRNERPGLLRYLRLQVGSEAAPDLVQEVFARAAGSRQAGHLVNPAGFLHRIARNLVIDRARRKRTRITMLAFDDAIDAPCAADQEQQIEAADLLAAYERAIALLPAKTRRVFLLHRVDERSYREIHEELGISVASVEYHMMKALAHLSRSLKVAR